MIVSLVLVALCGGLLWLALSLSEQLTPNALFPRIIIGGFVLRLVIQFFIRDIQFFSHAIGGDSILYEEYGRMISRLWDATGIHYVGGDEGFNLGATTLPQNMFAFFIHLNGGETCRLGCTAVVALAAALTALNIYLLAVQFGAEKKNAVLMASIIYFQPAFLFYTSDLYKDGLVLCIAFGALGSALRLSYRLSIVHVLIGAFSLFLLWFVRFYLIFVCIAPLLVGVAGLGSKKLTRPIFMGLALLVVAVVIGLYTNVLQAASERAAATFDQATSYRAIAGNYKEGTGSGVAFDDGGSPTGALPAKLAYTLFSPFPWAGGSMGFQIGKLDGFLWYFIIYRAIRAVKVADRRLLVMLATFVLPSTLMYAFTMANVGLIVRQRLVIVAATAVLAAIYSPKKAEVRAKRKTIVRRRRPPPQRAATATSDSIT